jgi:hypothetical protein
MPIYIKQLTYEERAVYGTCPVCGAKKRMPCDMMQGIPLNIQAYSAKPAGPDEFSDVGTHVARLINAPTQITVCEGSDITEPEIIEE